MKKISSAKGRRVFKEELAAPGDLAVPFAGEAYVAILWGCDGSHDADQRHDVAQTLIQSGCRYIVCGGENCEAWHDDADMAWVLLEIESASGSEMHMVMTTWHTGETEDEVADFALHSTNFEGYDFERYLVLLAGADVSNRDRVGKRFEDVFGRN